MAAPIRVALVDEDLRVHQLFERILRPPEFRPFLFADPSAGLMGLRDISPDVIICAVRMRILDGKTFHRAIKCSPQLCEVPFIFLASDPDSHKDGQTLLGPRDECLRKPVPVGVLLERIRAVGRRPRRTAGDPAARWLSGFTDRNGLFALLKLCEEACLTGRFTLETQGRTLWADWFAGRLTRAGVAGVEREGNVLELFLDTDGGRYSFEPRRVETATGRRSKRSVSGRAAEEGGHGPVGRFSLLEVEGGRLQVYTEGTHAPNFSITTVVAAAGRGVRKVESCWPHPLKRTADYAVAKEHIDKQHESVLSMVRDGVLAPQSRRAVWDVAGGGVEGALLVWVISLLRELARERLGTLPTLALLRRTHRQCAKHEPALDCFRVEDDGRIAISVSDRDAARTTLSGARLPRGAVQGVTAWATAFLSEAAPLAGTPRLPTLRKATRMMAQELDEIGFYEALRDQEAASGAARADTGT